MRHSQNRKSLSYVASQPESKTPKRLNRMRREWLQQLTKGCASVVALTGISGLISDVLAKGDLPVIQGIHQMTGEVFVNGKSAGVGTPVRAGDRVKTGAKSTAVIIFNKDAYLLRANSEVAFENKASNPNVALETIRILNGALLAVFKKGEPKQIRTVVATVGIRGTGAYFEALPNKVYFCLCYGKAEISGAGMDKPTLVETKYHEAPMWLTEDGAKMKMEKGPFLNHTDAELEMLEALCGRQTPFAQLPADTVRY